MPVESIRSVVQAAIERAAKATGVDFGFLLGTAKRESGYNPSARAPTSSAGGLFQVLDQTWLATLKKHGAKHGYARYAELITVQNGRYSVAGDDARKAVMALKMEPQANALMAAELTSDNAAYLKGRIGRAPTAGELYAAHFLGPQGSARLIQARAANPGASAAALFPEAAGANRSIFYKAGAPVSVDALYANLTKQGGAGNPVVASEPDGGFVQYASARRLDKLQQQALVVELLLRGPQERDHVSSLLAEGDSTPRLRPGLLSGEMLRALAQDIKN